jgi:Gas vesicle synthesis protein GvpO
MQRQAEDRERPRRRADEPRHRDPESRPKPLPAAEIARAGLEQIAGLTGRETQGVVSLEPEEDGWVVGVEVVEDRRIPSSTDVLALYEAVLDRRGNLVAYARKRRYARGKSDSGEVGR